MCVLKKLLNLPVGTKSILFGVHQFLWHPITVALAWKSLFGLPGPKELVCILVHDWGYWSCKSMNQDDGCLHPELGAKIAGFLFGSYYKDLCLYHSRQYASSHGELPSKLCLADKLSIKYEPRWFYLLRARLSGELYMYRCDMESIVSPEKGDVEWFDWLKDNLISYGQESKMVA